MSVPRFGFALHLNVLNGLPRNDGVLPSIVPFLAPTIQPQSPLTWNFTTVPQGALNDRVLFYSRGKLLGGSTSISTWIRLPVEFVHQTNVFLKIFSHLLEELMLITTVWLRSLMTKVGHGRNSLHTSPRYTNALLT